MDIVRICGVAIVCAVLAAILKNIGSPLYSALTAGGICLAASLLIPKISEIVNAAIDIEREGGASGYFPVVLKVAAASLICEFCADILTSSGDAAMTKALLTAGRIEILFLSLPLIKELFTLALSLCKTQ